MPRSLLNTIFSRRPSHDTIAKMSGAALIEALREKKVLSARVEELEAEREVSLVTIAEQEARINVLESALISIRQTLLAHQNPTS